MRPMLDFALGTDQDARYMLLAEGALLIPHEPFTCQQYGTVKVESYNATKTRFSEKWCWFPKIQNKTSTSGMTHYEVV